MALSLKNLGFCVFGARHELQKALSASNRLLATMSELLNKIPDVDIDAHGRFKYILVHICDDAAQTSKSIVRGYAKAEWHADIFSETVMQLEKYGLEAKCLGGGRIEHDPDRMTLKVYGYSQGFGKADHEVSVALLQRHYPDYEITCSDEGY